MHRTQPILDVRTLDVAGLEVLSSLSLDFSNHEKMIRADLAGIEYSIELVKRTGLRVHCNLEYATLVLAPWEIHERALSGIVIELTERHEILEKTDMQSRIAEEVAKIRRRGGLIAMDDVKPTELEITLIKTLQPDIIKVEITNIDALDEIRTYAKDALIIAERIETDHHTELARRAGTTGIQGLWCDRKATAYTGYSLAEDTHPEEVPLPEP